MAGSSLLVQDGAQHTQSINLSNRRIRTRTYGGGGGGAGKPAPLSRFTPSDGDDMPATAERPIALFHEHPDWFRPLFSELERRGTPFVRIPAAEHGYDPDARPPYSLVFNRMSPSAYLRGAGNAIFYTQSWLDHLERSGVRVVNGRAAYAVETSKAAQIHLPPRL